MKLHKIYSEAIAYLPENIREEIIKEAPHTRFLGPLPAELEFLGGTVRHLVDLGFENLGVPESERKTIYRAFTGPGVAVPNTIYKLRYANTGTAVVETVEEGEELVSLPEHWREAVLVFDGFEPSYIGELVRPNQY